MEVKDLSKAFPGVRALSGVNFQIYGGEVHALMGENGAGKSTLMRIVAGLDRADSGKILLSGVEVEFRDPHSALKHGVAMIHQELLPFPDLSVAENVFIGCEPVRGLGWVDRVTMERKAAELLGTLGLQVEAGRRMRDLSVAGMQTVEIARALVQQARVVIMDEPTSAVSDREVEALFGIIRRLKASGGAVIYISHKMDEIFRIADRITVLRDGRHIATRRSNEVTATELVQLMAGRELESARSGAAALVSGRLERPALSVKGLSQPGKFEGVSFDLFPGEILGIAGLMGAGRTEVLNAIYGMPPAAGGEILLGGEPVRIRSPREAIRQGIALVSEDRKQYGLVSKMSVKDNLTLSCLKRCSRGWFIDGGREGEIAAEQVKAFGIKSSGPAQLVKWLSGGNQQKVVLARALLHEPGILLLDEPTRGVDVGAKAEVHAIIGRLAQAGKAVLVVSSELPELLSMCDRVLVMRQGKIVAEVDARRTSQPEILAHAMPV